MGISAHLRVSLVELRSVEMPLQNESRLWDHVLRLHCAPNSGAKCATKHSPPVSEFFNYDFWPTSAIFAATDSVA